MNNSYNSFLDLLIGVPHGFIDPLLFNYIYNLAFFLVEEIVTSFADGTTLFSNITNMLTVLNDIETKVSTIFDYFSKYCVANPDKSVLLLHPKNPTKIESCIIKSRTSKKLFVVIVDNKLNFMEHILKLFKKGS